jgi:drug/metabolite transporter (DMT)-like permease
VIVALVLVSAFLHALWNALLRVEADKDRALVAAVLVATAIAAAVAAVRWLGLGDVPFATSTSFVWALGAGVLEWLYFASLARALEAGPLGTVYTISRGGAVLLVWPLSIALYGEVVTTGGAVGSGIVLAGLIVTGLRTGEQRGTHANAVAWAVACATSIAGYHLSYKAALRTGGATSAVFAVALALATAINLVRVGREGRRIVGTMLRTRTLRMFGMGAVCGGSFLILMEALAGGGAGYVLTLRNTSVLFATGMAFAIGERPSRAQIAGAALVAAGAALMA